MFYTLASSLPQLHAFHGVNARLGKTKGSQLESLAFFRIVCIVFQLRVVADTPRAFSITWFG